MDAWWNQQWQVSCLMETDAKLLELITWLPCNSIICTLSGVDYFTHTLSHNAMIHLTKVKTPDSSPCVPLNLLQCRRLGISYYVKRIFLKCLTMSRHVEDNKNKPSIKQHNSSRTDSFVIPNVYDSRLLFQGWLILQCLFANSRSVQAFSLNSFMCVCVCGGSSVGWST